MTLLEGREGIKAYSRISYSLVLTFRTTKEIRHRPANKASTEEATNMKDVSKICKSFTCECGTVNKFEFETDFDVHDVTMVVRCQECNREKNISMLSFFKRNAPSQEQNMFNPLANLPASQPISQSIFDDAIIPVGDMIASMEQPQVQEQLQAQEQPQVQEQQMIVQEQAVPQDSIGDLLSPSVVVPQKPQQAQQAEDEEELSYEEKEAFSDLFGKL
jgi:hypothetical protein